MGDDIETEIFFDKKKRKCLIRLTRAKNISVGIEHEDNSALNVNKHFFILFLDKIYYINCDIQTRKKGENIHFQLKTS